MEAPLIVPNLKDKNFIFFLFFFKIFYSINFISAYGDLVEKNTDENTKFSPTNLYGASKASCDLILEKYFENYNLDILALRFSTVYGPRRKTDCFIKDMVNAQVKLLDALKIDQLLYLF